MKARKDVKRIGRPGYTAEQIERLRAWLWITEQHPRFKTACQMKSDKTQILSSLRTIFVEALRVKPEEVVPEARVFSDLAAESIDILDVQFQIEHAFGLSLDQNALIEHLGQDLSAREIDEKLTVQWCMDYVESRLNETQGTGE